MNRVERLVERGLAKPKIITEIIASKSSVPYSAGEPIVRERTVAMLKPASRTLGSKERKVLKNNSQGR